MRARRASSPRSFSAVEAALRNDERALVVVAAVQHDEDLAGAEPADRLLGVVRAARKAHPERVHGRPDILDRKAGLFAHQRVAPVGADDEVGPDLELAFGRPRAHADDAPVLRDEVGGFGLHAQREAGISLGVQRQEIEEIPLRHEGDEPAARRQMREVGERELGVADHAPDLSQLLVRPAQELVEQAELVDQLERRGMDRVAAEIAQEVGVLLEHDHVDAGARQKEAQHHAGGSAADDAAAAALSRRRHLRPSSASGNARSPSAAG